MFNTLRLLDSKWFHASPACLARIKESVCPFRFLALSAILLLLTVQLQKKWTPWLLERHPLTMAYQALACQVCPQWQGDTICLCLSQMLALCKDVSIMCRWVVEGPATCSVESRTGGPVNCYGNSALKGTKISQLVPSSWKSPYFKYKFDQTCNIRKKLASGRLSPNPPETKSNYLAWAS